MVSVEAQIEAAELGYWSHISDPLTNWATYELLTDGLLAVKRERLAALARHDHGQADRLTLEANDLTALCAAAADGLALQRWRWLCSDPPQPWPLAAGV
jgi:hypothetical protein